MFQNKSQFQARSGRTLKIGADGTIQFHLGNGYLSPECVMDVEEFLQARRDEDLDRWRWPLNPNYVVRRKADGRGVRVLNEVDCDVVDFPDRARADSFPNSAFGRAAVAFFEAHPEQKPWHLAQLGEIWAVTIRGVGHITKVISPRDGISSDGAEFAFQALDVQVTDWVYRESPWITAGRRIWPEDAS